MPLAFGGPTHPLPAVCFWPDLEVATSRQRMSGRAPLTSARIRVPGPSSLSVAVSSTLVAAFVFRTVRSCGRGLGEVCSFAWLGGGVDRPPSVAMPTGTARATAAAAATVTAAAASHGRRRARRSSDSICRSARCSTSSSSGLNGSAASRSVGSAANAGSTSVSSRYSFWHSAQSRRCSCISNASPGSSAPSR